MIVYRLAKEKYKNDLSGKGAEIAGGRWNSAGHAMLYTSESRALCTAEIAVHSPLGILPKDYYLVSIEIPDSIDIKGVTAAQLPGDWTLVPHAVSTQLIGDKFLKEGKYAVMKVPSVVVPGDYNYLVNPLHDAFAKVKVKKTEQLSFDKWLFVR